MGKSSVLQLDFQPAFNDTRFGALFPNPLFTESVLPAGQFNRPLPNKWIDPFC